MSIVTRLRRDPNPRTRSLYDAPEVERRLSYAEHQSEVIECQAQVVTAQTSLAKAQMNLSEAQQRLSKFLADDLSQLGIPVDQILKADGVRRASLHTEEEGTPSSGSES